MILPEKDNFKVAEVLIRLDGYTTVNESIELFQDLCREQIKVEGERKVAWNKHREACDETCRIQSELLQAEEKLRQINGLVSKARANILSSVETTTKKQLELEGKT
jgi:hypothetical protein